jgi:L-ascorbate metabolism protein UlaG (beta-lactamase superfamily)
MINVKWFGHSMWKIWNDKVSIITDPFSSIGYKLPVNETADIVLSSHAHSDHNNFSLIDGDPEIYNEPGEYNFKSVKIKNMQVWHDDSKGSQRGTNLLMKFNVSGKNFLHCGDLGHLPETSVIAELGRIDVLFVPIGGTYTIDALQAKKVIELLSPVIIFPMHYKTRVLDFPIKDEKTYKDIIPACKKIDSNQIILTESDFQQQISIFLDYE